MHDKTYDAAAPFIGSNGLQRPLMTIPCGDASVQGWNRIISDASGKPQDQEGQAGVLHLLKLGLAADAQRGGEGWIRAGCHEGEQLEEVTSHLGGICLWGGFINILLLFIYKNIIYL